MSISRHALAALLTLSAFGCSTTPAPVIDRTPAVKPAVANKPNTTVKAPVKPANGKNGSDWRPDVHTVKKGDTLFSIGLEYGYYYKDIARVNDIEAPYVIKIGQVLKLADLKDKSGAAETKAEPVQEEGVITYPIIADSTASPPVTTTASAPAAVTANAVTVINEPKAIREPYSEAALKASLPAAKPVTLPPAAAKADVKPATEVKPDAKLEAKPEPKPESKPAAEPAGSINWAWPTKGKVISGFNDGGNKGIDIAGSKGQPILAAAPGKVIYSGSDLRGYGKLVIVKHNNTYLSVYANNSTILVKEGQQVSAGQKIAEMGDTDSNTVKLHFEIRQQGKSVDPAKFLGSN
ncbi:peptidoglycan DD-metalloendopeptidase family protein [Methylotenera sp. G11]|uniref:peptidoglycan DD-metalloendopeptidase family protein n=1 Tax=Methylotenera sp. G11 TaxID=1506585 RepID=UPI00068F92B9|nr:peptidoglycan DD-metalloendopeptidase family protein [Methylotenera sp. G11]